MRAQLKQANNEKGKVESLQEQLANANKKISELTAFLEEAQANIADGKEQFGKAQTQYELEIEELKAGIKGLQTRIRENNLESKRRNASNQNLQESRNIALEAEVASKAEIEAKLDTAVSTIQELETEMKQSKSTSSKEVASLQDALRRALEEKDAILRQIQSDKDGNQSKNREYKRLVQEHAALQQSIQRYTEQIESLQTQIEELKLYIQELTAKQQTRPVSTSFQSYEGPGKTLLEYCNDDKIEARQLEKPYRDWPQQQLDSECKHISRIRGAKTGKKKRTNARNTKKQRKNSSLLE
jgi:chromosome segregation ATPase